MNALSMILFFTCSHLIMAISASSGNFNTSHSIRDGETIVSADGTFELGFFSPGSSKRRFLGIWYHKLSGRVPVWVANRERPLFGSSGMLKLTSQGVLNILDKNGSTIWSSNSSTQVRSPLAQLLDSGNLVVKDRVGADDQEIILWQSFDYPGDTGLPDMKIGRNLKTGMDWSLLSWRTPDDPSPGYFTFRMDLNGYPEFFLRNGSVKIFRFGPWNGLRFSGIPILYPRSILSFEYVQEEEIYFRYRIMNTPLSTSLVLTHDGILRIFMRKADEPNWTPYPSMRVDDCDDYARCGAFGVCNVGSAPICGCLTGFFPRSESAAGEYMVDWSEGCVRKTPLSCSQDGFLNYTGIKLPETRNSWYSKSMNLEQCGEKCKNNCSCTAYASLDLREGGSGCLLWFHDLIDIRKLGQNGQDIFIRLAASDIVHGNKIRGSNVKKDKKKLLFILILPCGLLILGLSLVLYARKRKQRRSSDKYQQKDLELPMFDFDTVVSATNGFSDMNKLGEGGFGPVYKGRLKDKQEIAVKRLSKTSRQGIDEFKNEVMHIAKLQHKNLVRLIGCCIQGEEKMLIYEFMPNRSLDFFIFDQAEKTPLKWTARYKIIKGIARGLVYLHHDSRLTIIHRDLKAGNILLDFEMNPKISDFGLAKSFGGNETEGSTKKVVGTFGYMSPEYATNGHYSLKSDVFSFGVIVLEIVSGKRNRGFRNAAGRHLDLLGHAWELYKEARFSELIPANVRESCNLSEVLRAIHVGLLCVQRYPKHRPNMSSVVLMLEGEGELPQPKQPGFFSECDINEASSSSTNRSLSSANTLTLTSLHAR